MSKEWPAFPVGQLGSSDLSVDQHKLPQNDYAKALRLQGVDLGGYSSQAGGITYGKDGNAILTPITPVMRQFDSGATRHTDEGKLDFEGFLSPLALDAFARYMHKNRLQADGGLRDSDNWQKGIPVEAYQKSLIRHVFDAWARWRQLASRTADATPEEFNDLVEALCAIQFNVQGMIHELLREKV